MNVIKASLGVTVRPITIRAEDRRSHHSQVSYVERRGVLEGVLCRLLRLLPHLLIAIAVPVVPPPLLSRASG